MNIPLCAFAAISDGRTDSNAQVPPVFVPDCDSALVATSILPATLDEALGVEPLATFTQAPATKVWYNPVVVLNTIPVQVVGNALI